MPRLSRRALLGWLSALTLSGLTTGAYAFRIEPRFLLDVTRYRLAPPRWTPNLRLEIAIISDLHACEETVPVERIEEIVSATNALQPDVVLLLGDYIVGPRFDRTPLPYPAWTRALAGLKAPLGRYAVLGNHDFWDDPEKQHPGSGPPKARLALEAAGIPVLENDAVRLEKGGLPFWLLGLGDQLAYRLPGHGRFRGRHDLEGGMAKITDDAPIILMAHEPDIFPKIPERVSLTLSGHTHGGQVRLFGWSPIVPSRYGNRYAYGHVVEKGRHLVVSGGLGTSLLPLRLGVPPEIVHLTLEADALTV